jgi:hypothetical protein
MNAIILLDYVGFCSASRRARSRLLLPATKLTGGIRICLGLIHTSNDVQTLASRCRDEANAADAAALDLAG